VESGIGDWRCLARMWRVTGVCVEGVVEETAGVDVNAGVSVRESV
jgi:hypothetical protein